MFTKQVFHNPAHIPAAAVIATPHTIPPLTPIKILGLSSENHFMLNLTLVPTQAKVPTPTPTPVSPSQQMLAVLKTKQSSKSTVRSATTCQSNISLPKIVLQGTCGLTGRAPSTWNNSGLWLRLRLSWWYWRRLVHISLRILIWYISMGDHLSPEKYTSKLLDQA